MEGGESNKTEKESRSGDEVRRYNEIEKNERNMLETDNGDQII